MTEQEYTVSGTSPYRIGDMIYGFDFGMGRELKGKIVEIKSYIVFAYVLDTGGVLGVYDDVYGKVEDGEHDRARTSSSNSTSTLGARCAGAKTT